MACVWVSYQGGYILNNGNFKPVGGSSFFSGFLLFGKGYLLLGFCLVKHLFYEEVSADSKAVHLHNWRHLPIPIPIQTTECEIP